MKKGTRILFIICLFLVFTLPVWAKDWNDWGSMTQLEKNQLAGTYAHQRCGSKDVSNGNTSVPWFVTANMVKSYIDKECPAKRANLR